MTCENCNPYLNKPGILIKVKPDRDEKGHLHCAICDMPVIFYSDDKEIQPRISNNPWDQYFYRICEAVASKSSCLSRKIGAILVKDHSIVSTGFNGPSRGVPHCGHERLMKDNTLSHEAFLSNDMKIEHYLEANRRFSKECPRKILGYKSGTHMELCPAQHAEVNAIIDAARKGASAVGTTLYMNCIIPCKNCYGALINAGVVEIVVDDTKVYDKHTQYLIDNSSIKIRRFSL